MTKIRSSKEILDDPSRPWKVETETFYNLYCNPHFSFFFCPFSLTFVPFPNVFSFYFYTLLPHLVSLSHFASFLVPLPRICSLSLVRIRERRTSGRRLVIRTWMMQEAEVQPKCFYYITSEIKRTAMKNTQVSWGHCSQKENDLWRAQLPMLIHIVIIWYAGYHKKW